MLHCVGDAHTLEEMIFLQVIFVSCEALPDFRLLGVVSRGAAGDDCCTNKQYHMLC